LNQLGNPTLAYLYRRWLARHLVKDVHPGRFLEIGVGSGRFYEDLLEQGFHGIGLDLNPDLIAEHQADVSSHRGTIEFRSLDFFLITDHFELVVAFEVLEHYEQDVVCLEQWRTLLNPGGTLLFSVPAHMKQWTENDIRAGHARRYEKADLLEKVRKAGLSVEEFWCYGFPLLNWTYRLSSRYRLSREARRFTEMELRKQIHEDSGIHSRPAAKISRSLMTDFESTFGSGTRRFARLPRILISGGIWWPFLQLQMFWLKKDRGIGYIVKCHR
jgi:2-polyprenyl-3-methyl-5-hydroxy-6-metoxy-1,4-benzoquinol methylase